jgi:2-polyprenyl-3-methyl-5-hydroxy-6-metoxy-1,4-benzoquinol methylase
MSINYIVNKCWCGENEINKKIKDTWVSDYFGEVNYEIASCIKCKTFRTINSINKVIDYSETIIYNQELSIRQLNSIKTIRKYLQPESLIDIGSSSGAVLKKLSEIESNISYYGIDLNKNAIESKLVNVNVEYKNLTDVENRYDNIILLHTLEHIPELDTFFNELNRISNSGAIIYIAVPNFGGLNAKFRKNIWGALNPTQHTWHFTKQTLKKLIKQKLNCNILEVKTSWIFIPPFLNPLFKFLPGGDQIEIIIKLN